MLLSYFHATDTHHGKFTWKNDPHKAVESFATNAHWWRRPPYWENGPKIVLSQLDHCAYGITRPQWVNSMMFEHHDHRLKILKYVFSSQIDKLYSPSPLWPERYCLRQYPLSNVCFFHFIHIQSTHVLPLWYSNWFYWKGIYMKYSQAYFSMKSVA